MSLYKHIHVDEAIKEHSTLIAKLRETCAEEIALDSKQFDDNVFLVRFCISHKGDQEKTIHAAKTCMNWRHKNREELARRSKGYQDPVEKKMRFISPFGVHGHFKDGSPMVIVRSGLSDPALVLETFSEEEIVRIATFSKEEIYEYLDSETRKRGYFVKAVFLNDYKRGSVWDFSMSLMKIFAKASNEIELMYPQYLGTSLIMNPLSTFKALMPVCRAIFPEAVMSKIKTCGATSTVTESISKCPIAGSGLVIDLDDLPTFLGGKCNGIKCGGKEGCCINGVPNDRKEKMTKEDLEEFVKKMEQQQQQKEEVKK